jgi:ABC-type branched-subunit amino acid transport system ATPase component
VSENALSCHHLSKQFGGVVALDDFSVQLPPRGIVAIVGPNGSGKSTFFNVVTGFVGPDDGSCRLFGREIIGLAPHRIARLGMVRSFQHLRLVQQISVLEQVLLAFQRQPAEGVVKAMLGFGRAEERRNRDEALRLLQWAGLAQAAGAQTQTLSHGQQKILCLLVVLATGARVLLLDEPFAGLQPQAVAKTAEMLVEVSRTRLIVFVEHDLDAVRECAERVLLMSAGRLAMDGEAATVLHHPNLVHEYLR